MANKKKIRRSKRFPYGDPFHEFDELVEHEETIGMLILYMLDAVSKQQKSEQEGSVARRDEPANK